MRVVLTHYKKASRVLFDQIYYRDGSLIQRLKTLKSFYVLAGSIIILFASSQCYDIP